MVETWTIPYPGQTVARHVYVYVPDGSRSAKRRRYPVLYMFDGHNLFFDETATYGKCWGLKTFLDRNAMPLIVVGVECNHDPDHGRLREYSPFSFTADGIGTVHGEGHKTLEWITSVLKPLVDQRYPTRPGRRHTYIGGSSMGGLMSLYALCSYGHVFSRAAALSPSLWVAPDEVDRMLRQTKFAPDTILYMDYGEKELSRHRQTALCLTKASACLMRKHVLLTMRIVPAGQHCEASWEKQIPFFLPVLLYDQH